MGVLKYVNENSIQELRVVLIILKSRCNTLVGGSHKLFSSIPGNLTILFAVQRLHVRLSTTQNDINDDD